MTTPITLEWSQAFDRHVGEGRIVISQKWDNDMAKENINERSPLKTLTIYKAIQRSIEAWNLMLKDIINMYWRNSGLFCLPVIGNSEDSFGTLPDASGESETKVAFDNVLSDDEGLEMIGNVTRDKELDELIFRQFSQPHISNPSAAAKYIDPLKAEISNIIFSLQ